MTTSAAAAATGLADAVATGDRDVLVLDRDQGIPILTPRALAHLLA